MYKILLFTLLGLAPFFVLAQDAPAERSKEVHLGPGVARGVFIPRIMLKTVRGNRATRYTLQLEASTQAMSNGPNFFNPYFRNESSQQFLDAALGFGKEFRKELGNNFGVHYGGTLRILYDTRRTFRLNSDYSSGDRVDVEIVDQSYYFGLALHAFAGLFWRPTPKLVISFEAGPTMQGGISANKSNRIITDYSSGSPISTEDRDTQFSGFDANLQLFSPVYLQAGLSF